MLELYTKLGVHFTQSDKEACRPLVYRFAELSKMVRQHGLLVLDLEVENDENLFMSTAIGMVVDGVAAQKIRAVLQALILSGKHSGAALLSRLLIAEGALALQETENARMMVLRLSAMLGEVHMEQITEALFATQSRKQVLSQFYSAINGKRLLPGSAAFERLFMQLDTRSVQQILRGVHDQALLEALRGCSYGLIRRVLGQLSMNASYWIAENWDLSDSLQRDTIYKCQEEILRKALVMEERGEVVGVERLLREAGDEV